MHRTGRQGASGGGGVGSARARGGGEARHVTRGAGASGVRRSEAAAARSLGRGRAVAGMRAAAGGGSPPVLVLPNPEGRRPAAAWRRVGRPATDGWLPCAPAPGHWATCAVCGW